MSIGMQGLHRHTRMFRDTRMHRVDAWNTFASFVGKDGPQTGVRIDTLHVNEA